MKLLVANRGEIAVRIARAARRAGIPSVAVFAPPDRQALHVRECDEAVGLPGSDLASTYLSIPALLEAARQSGASAVHPGYGFLAESAAFAREVEKAGLVWVGPHAEAIARMGSKIEARRLAAAAGVPVIPGFDASQEPAALYRASLEIGYPVMLKASAGGGGKGIRVAATPEDFEPALASARDEARRAFGDDAMIVERYVERPRHIEVQVFGDRHGSVLHLGTRECSIQRRHQKLVEEAPAPGLPDETRSGLEQAAVGLAREIGYDNAGTVEFVLDDDSGAFFFLEMNTRLQVEHPVTELVTGVDLVAWQLAVASGERLPVAQEAIGWRGHAMEVRLNAEDPWQEFMPQTGRIAWLGAPRGVRFDEGIATGSVVTPHYDSMLAKLVALGDDRDEARRRLVAALAELHVAGLRTNQAFLRWLLQHPAVVAGPVTTRFLDETPLPDPPIPADLAVPAALLWLAAGDASVRAHPSPWRALGPLRVTPHRPPRVVVLEHADGQSDVAISGFGGRYEVAGDGPWRAEFDGEWLRLEQRGHVTRLPAQRTGDRLSLVRDGTTHGFRVVHRAERFGGEGGRDASPASALVSPFPGLVTEVRVAAGDEVHEGDVVVVIEAMKMLHALTASGHGVVARVHAEEGMSVDSGTVLVSFETE